MKGNCYDINSTDQLHIYTNHIKKSVDCLEPKTLSMPYETGTEAWNILSARNLVYTKSNFWMNSLLSYMHLDYLTTLQSQEL